MLLKIASSVYRRVNNRALALFNRTPNNNYSKPILTSIDANAAIKKLLVSDKPVMIARFGRTEMSCVINYLSMKTAKENSFTKIRLQIKQGVDGYWKGWNNEVKENMCSLSGMFPKSEDMLNRFAELMLTQMKELDVLGVWNLYGEDYVQKRYFKDASLIGLMSIEPYYHEDPWIKCLQGKKVLVIHPFEESIITNYKNREKIFPNGFLPAFELKTIKAVQSIAHNTTSFTDWFEAYDYMCRQIDATDFDIAIIGAGAYGFPLAAYVKQVGKKSIHIGGATQVLFGIKGKRWDDNPFFQALYNEHWTRPLPSEIPRRSEIVEDSCYW
ncbi:MAG: hypothetical protein H7Z13_10570 [Ferruginibacter sp.]|nr:hypothetical protein [Ferruginibacter sp.]